MTPLVQNLCTKDNKSELQYFFMVLDWSLVGVEVEGRTHPYLGLYLNKCIYAGSSRSSASFSLL